MFASAVAGFALGASLIVAIGAQNAFVLKQGLRRNHVLAVVATCALIDAVLISAGVGGFGSLISAYPLATKGAALAGVLFLAVYGFGAFRSALRPAALHAAQGEAPSGVGAVLLATLAVSLLNPHVYLDTIVLMGSVAAQRPAALRPAFALGAMTASFVWFFGLGFGARLLDPLFEKPAAWRVLDVVIGVVMWSVAVSLVIGLVR